MDLDNVDSSEHESPHLGKPTRIGFHTPYGHNLKLDGVHVPLRVHFASGRELCCVGSVKMPVSWVSALHLGFELGFSEPRLRERLVAFK